MVFNPYSSSSANAEEGWTQQKLNLPLGYRFIPTDVELVLNYLLTKIIGNPLPADIIPMLDGYYTKNPEELPIGESQYWKEKEAYFFTSKDENSSRLDKTQKGFWNVDLVDEHIVHNMTCIGFKSRFTFYNDKNEKTNWVMTEFRVHPRLIPDVSKDKKLIVCRIQYDPEKNRTYEGCRTRGQPNKILCSC